VAQALNSPVLLIGKPGVGDAVDSYNLNRIFFESFGVRVLGGIFNKLPTVSSTVNDVRAHTWSTSRLTTSVYVRSWNRRRGSTASMLVKRLSRHTSTFTGGTSAHTVSSLK
jgi:hypothetical protein